MNHRIKATPTGKKPLEIHRDNPVAPAWPSYTGTSQFVGTSPSGRVTVYVDPTLSQPGLQNAEDLVNDADRVVTANDGIFGTTGGPVSVIVFALGGATDGTGGADHMGCDYSSGAAIEVDASFGNSARVSALFEAELSECSMNGNLCGLSTGEALSRWCAAVIGNNALSDFATAPQWAQDSEPDFVDKTDPTDQNADSIGCGMAFLSWLISQGYGLEKIAPAMVNLGNSGTLAQLYANLTSDAAYGCLDQFSERDPEPAERRHQRRSFWRISQSTANGPSGSPDGGTGGQGFRVHYFRSRRRPAAGTDDGQRARGHAPGGQHEGAHGLRAQIEAPASTRQKRQGRTPEDHKVGINQKAKKAPAADSSAAGLFLQVNPKPLGQPIGQPRNRLLQIVVDHHHRE